MHKILFFFILSFYGYISFSQSYSKKENNIWISSTNNVPDEAIYGTTPDPIYYGTGINFNINPPSQVDAAGTYGAYTGVEGRGTASICGSNGNLLFYTDGNIVWDRNNNVMPDGWGINDNDAPPYHLSTSGWGTTESGWNFDGVIIARMPGSAYKYYIFDMVDTLGPDSFMGGYSEAGGGWEGKLRYTIVDMEKNGGLGAVDTAHRGIVIADSMSGNLQIVEGEDCNYWLVGNFSAGGFRSFNITANGIDAVPVVSTVIPPLQPYCYELNISPDRTKLAEAYSEEVQLCNFDAATGIVSDYSPTIPILIGSQTTYSVAFSPNSSKMYLGGIIGLRQYDISGATPTFNSPPISVNTSVYEYYGPLRLAPDNKIYIDYTSSDNHAGWAVQHPDNAFAACDLDSISNAPLILKRNLWFIPQFPNEVAVINYDTASQTVKAPICFDDSNAVLRPVPLPDTGTDYHWKMKSGVNYIPVGNDTTALSVTHPGIYTVQYFTANPCTLHQDTFLVDHVAFSVSMLRNDPPLSSCDGKPITLVPYTDASSPAYLWQDGSTGATLAADTSGWYKVSISSTGCTAADSIHLFIVNVNQSLRDDTVLCAEAPEQKVLLKAQVPAGASVLWSTGSKDTSIYVSDSGWYYVQVTDSACTGIDSFHLGREYCECPILFPTAFSPNSDGTNDYYKPSIPINCSITAYKMEIYNRWGQRVYVGYNGDKGWDGLLNGTPADVGTYMYRIQMTIGLEKEAITKKGDFVLLR